MISITTYIIVCPLLFLAGFVDSIAGGGGLISLPAYLLAGLPIHNALGTNKFSSCCGTMISVARFLKNGMVNLKLALPAVACGLTGSAIGAKLSMTIPEKALMTMLLVVLPVAAFCVLNKKLFKDRGEGSSAVTKRSVAIAAACALIIGMYDGMYGPGTGTFLIIAFTVGAKLGIAQSNANAKVINLSTNMAALAVFLLHGQVIITVGIAAAISNMLGNYLGSGLVITKGARIVRPLIIAVLILLFFRQVVL